MTVTDAKRIDAARSENDTSSAGLISQLANDVSDLVTTEMKLAKAEMQQSVEDAKTGVAGIAVASAALGAGALLLIASIPMALSAFTGLDLWLSTLLVGIAATLVAWLMLSAAKNKLSAENLKPSRTADALNKDKAMVENNLS